jgi:hypothetical protein
MRVCVAGYAVERAGTLADAAPCMPTDRPRCAGSRAKAPTQVCEQTEGDDCPVTTGIANPCHNYRSCFLHVPNQCDSHGQPLVRPSC